MIAWLKGSILSKQAPVIVLNVNGVGYALEAPMTTFYDLPPEGSDVELFIHMVVREDAQLLFAFINERKRDMFRGLIKVNGVGPKVALAILSTMSVQEIMLCMANEDVALLTKVPGIGKKTAQRLVVELKDRLEKQFGDLTVQSQSPANAPTSNASLDAIEALSSLGYKPAEATRVVRGLGDDLTSEELIRQALRALSGNVL